MEGLRGYCDDLELEEMGKVTIPYTGNAAADGVLYHYGCIARAKNIEFFRMLLSERYCYSGY